MSPESTMIPPPSLPAVAEGTTTILRRRAPTLYIIIGIKLVKGVLLVAAAIAAYTLSDNNLPSEFRSLLKIFHLDPGKKFFADLAMSLGSITENKMLWVASGTFIYSLFSLVEGIGLIFRVSWACYLAIAESAFFIPIEVYELVHHRFTWTVFGILALNVLIVWYLFVNRHRLFRHHHHH